MAVGTDAHASALGQEVHGGENAIAQIGFGGQAQAGNGLAAGHQADFFRVGMGGVDQAPACIDLDIVVEPLQRARAAPGQAVVDFLLLLGNMDMHRAVGGAGRQHGLDLLRRYRPQGVKA